MKSQSKIFIFLSIIVSFCLITKITPLAYTYQYILHRNSEFPKVCTLKDGNVIVVSSALGASASNVTKLDKEGNILFTDEILNKGFSEDAHIVQPENSDFYLMDLHGRETGNKKDTLLTFKDKSNIIKSTVRKNGIYQKTSVVALKNGKVLVAGIGPKSTFGSETTAEINVYDPSTFAAGNGITFNGHSDYISCFEQKDNDVYCVYVSYEDLLVSKLKIQHIGITGSTLTEKGEQVIKAFYTEFNFLKAIPFNEKESLVLFQTGNGGKKLGHEGTRLFFYHLEVTSGTFLVNVKRYEYLYPSCLYEKGNHDPEHQNADIAVLSKNRIFAVCETSLNKFRGFIIYPDRPEKVEIDEFNFNNFDADDVKSPMFTKFGQCMGIFYTQILHNKNKQVSFHIMNYPDCTDYKASPILIPKFYLRELDFVGRVYLNNPYLFDRADELIRIRFKNYSNIEITNTLDKTPIKEGFDYNPALTLKFVPKDISGYYNFEYTATIEDVYDGLIIGKTCKVPFYTPECLEQCYSCTEKGTVERHFCLGCKNDSYYEEEDPLAVNIGFGKPHNCSRCNESCYNCYYKFVEKPYPTTNCKKCDYDNNYFHFEGDERTCISNETKSYWKWVFGRAIYLDKTPGEDKKHLWRWRFCHKNCDECFEGGDDIDNKCYRCVKGLYFFCNQTDGHGIPGSCHSDCVDNGFYATKDEIGRDKCCPCLDHCQKCTNETICNRCYTPFLLTPKHDRCNSSCGYCLAEDHYLGECVNCKTRYPTPKYLLNKTCVNEIPFIDFIKRYYHIIDDTCNYLIGCKEGCYKCDPWYTDICTECDSNYYKEDPFGKVPQPTKFRCFNKTTCQGVTPYIHNTSLRIGGVPIKEDDTNVCLNCKLRNNSYRLPEDKFYCSDVKIKRTFIDIEEYNKLTYCYLRCASCRGWGNCMAMNCDTCRDSANYELFKIGDSGNCYRKVHKCGIYPYYHDYDLAEVLGKDEDNCGEDCDVCLYNFTCTDTFPFFIYETHECVEYCPLTDVMGNACGINNRAGMILLNNPLGLRNTYDFVNSTVTLDQIINSKFFEYIVSSYQVDKTTIKNDINNYVGHGQIYNLPESKIIVGNNISIELSSVRLELEKITKLFTSTQTTTTTTKQNTSAIDLSSCQTILKKKYGLPDAEDLMVLKGDFLQQLSEQYLSNQVEYQLFSTSLGAFLPLNDCKEANTYTTVYNPFNISNLLGSFQLKTAAAVNGDHNPYDVNSAFYNDICTEFTNENGNDVLLEDRRTDYYNNQTNICEKGCKFLGYNETNGMYACNCSIKGGINDNIEFEDTSNDTIPDSFYKKEMGYSNIKVFKCASQVFSSKGQKLNFGSYALLICFVGFVAMVVLYFVKGTKTMDDEFAKLGNNSDSVAVPANPPKPVDKEKLDYDILVKNKKPSNVIQDIQYNEEELNEADYDTAVTKDKRSFIRYYCSLIKMKQLCVFTFYTYTDHNLKCVKIALFILFLAFYFAFTALFFNDKIIREIYIYKGNTDAAVHVTNIVLSSLCSIIMGYIIRFVSLSERDIMAITRETIKENRKVKAESTKLKLKIKLIVVFVLSGLLIGLCWYYVSAFCAVFKNSQGHYFINVLVAFIVCNIWPCVTSLIAPIFRMRSIKNGNSPCMYKFSQIIAYF